MNRDTLSRRAGIRLNGFVNTGDQIPDGRRRPPPSPRRRNAHFVEPVGDLLKAIGALRPYSDEDRAKVQGQAQGVRLDGSHARSTALPCTP